MKRFFFYRYKIELINFEKRVVIIPRKLGNRMKRTIRGNTCYEINNLSWRLAEKREKERDKKRQENYQVKMIDNKIRNVVFIELFIK